MRSLEAKGPVRIPELLLLHHGTASEPVVVPHGTERAVVGDPLEAIV